MVLTTIIKCIVLLMGQLLFFSDIRADPNILETIIVTETNEEIPLRWVETERFLANEHLPIWLTTDSPESLRKDSDVMNLVGPFKLYHAVDESSAVVYFERPDCIRGVVGLKYFINCLPYDQIIGHRHKVGESPYVILIDARELSSLASIESSANQYNAHRSCAISSLENSPHLYPEILILISNEIVMKAIPNGVQDPDYKLKLSTLVMQYIVDFNAVAMLFARLAEHDIKIHINMAGLVFEMRHNQFPFIPPFGSDPPQGTELLKLIVKYIKNLKVGRQKLFVDDSFDMFLLSTTMQWREGDRNPNGISTPVFDVLKQRKVSTPCKDKTFLGSIVNGGDSMQYYDRAAREIAHLMDVSDDEPHAQRLYRGGEECHAIMEDSLYRPNSLSWSYKSIAKFRHYIRWHKNACFLRNFPRSIYPFDVPVESLSPVEQCRCYGHQTCMDLTFIDMVYGNCKKALRCQDNFAIRNYFTIAPVDGTPCSGNNINGVCWRGNCVPTLYRRN